MLTCPCNHCSTILEFPPEGVGQEIQCPTCGLDTKLFRSPVVQQLEKIEPPPIRIPPRTNTIPSGLMQCKTCSGKIAATTEVCPHCGENLPAFKAMCSKCGSGSVHITKRGYSLKQAGIIIAGFWLILFLLVNFILEWKGLAFLLFVMSPALLICGLIGSNEKSCRCLGCSSTIPFRDLAIERERQIRIFAGMCVRCCSSEIGMHDKVYKRRARIAAAFSTIPFLSEFLTIYFFVPLIVAAITWFASMAVLRNRIVCAQCGTYQPRRPPLPQAQ